MNTNDIYERPINNPEHKDQPWYTKWSEGNKYALMFNVYIDTIFIGFLFSFVASILISHILSSGWFVLLLFLSPLPLMTASYIYYENVYHYTSSLGKFSLKPTFKFISLYQLIIISASILLLI